jgi:hypothetical protein
MFPSRRTVSKNLSSREISAETQLKVEMAYGQGRQEGSFGLHFPGAYLHCSHEVNELSHNGDAEYYFMLS